MNVLQKITLCIAVLSACFLASCSQAYTVTKAPHRKQVTDKVPGIVLFSHPVKVSKNSGIGQNVGGLGGALAGASAGAGTGRVIGVLAGRFIGGIGGGKAELKFRQKDAQELLLKLKGISHKFIYLDDQHYKTGDKIWAETNVYGEPIKITPR